VLLKTVRLGFQRLEDARKADTGYDWNERQGLAGGTFKVVSKDDGGEEEGEKGRGGPDYLMELR
jgi:hypothetical protein